METMIAEAKVNGATIEIFIKQVEWETKTVFRVYMTRNGNLVAANNFFEKMDDAVTFARGMKFAFVMTHNL